MTTAARIGGIALVATLLAACGIGDRQARADLVMDAVDVVADAGHFAGSLIVTETRRPRDARRASGEVTAADQALALENAKTFDVAVDLDGRFAALFEGPEARGWFDELVVFGTRKGISERDARPWLAIDLEEASSDIRIDHRSQPVIALAYVLHPAVYLDLMSAPLTGSVDEPTIETIGGVEYRRFDATVDVEKMFVKTRRGQYRNDEYREAIESVFDQLGVKGTLHEASAWLAADGALHAFEITFELRRPSPSIDLFLSARIEIDPTATPISGAPPRDDDLLRTDDLLSFVNATVPSQEAAQPSPGLAPVAEVQEATP